MPYIETLFSDADGTLIDTTHLIRRGQYEASKAYLEQRGIPEEDILDYGLYETHQNEVVGGSTRETFERTLNLLFKDRKHHLQDINFDELNALLDPIQDELAPKCVKQFSGLSQLLRWLGETDKTLAIFTSGSPHHVVRNFGIALPELEYVTLYKDKSFSDNEKLTMLIDRMKAVHGVSKLTIVTCEDVTTTKPHPEGLILARQRLKADFNVSAVLGDHKVDMQTAIAAHVPVRIGITHGFDDRQILLNAGATVVIDSLGEIPGVIGGKE